MRARRIFSWLVFVPILMVMGCGTLGLGGGGTIARIQKTGELRVAMAGDYPPMNVRTRDGRLIGLEVDLAAALASILEVELVTVEKPFGELLDAVTEGEADLAISGITMTPRRNMEVAFAGPYYVSRKALLGKAETLVGLADLTDLEGQGLRVAAVSGSTSEMLVKKLLPNTQHLIEPTQQDAVERVLRGQADVMVGDDPVVRFALLRNPYAGLAFVESAFSAEPLGIAISADDPLFVNLVENFLRNLEFMGLMNTLRATWFENGVWLELLP